MVSDEDFGEASKALRWLDGFCLFMALEEEGFWGVIRFVGSFFAFGFIR